MGEDRVVGGGIGDDAADLLERQDDEGRCGPDPLLLARTYVSAARPANLRT
jgi:hypothetical protein